jgi:hypothetical protein
MPHYLIEVGISVLISGAAGGVSGWQVCTRRCHRNDADCLPVLTPVGDEWVDEMADEWCRSHDRPEIRGLIANRLRLGATLIERRNRIGRSK